MCFAFSYGEMAIWFLPTVVHEPFLLGRKTKLMHHFTGHQLTEDKTLFTLLSSACNCYLEFFLQIPVSVSICSSGLFTILEQVSACRCCDHCLDWIAGASSSGAAAEVCLFQQVWYCPRRGMMAKGFDASRHAGMIDEVCFANIDHLSRSHSAENGPRCHTSPNCLC